METKCHNCKYREDPDRLERCLKCTKIDDDSYHGKVVHLNGRNPPAVPQRPSVYVTSLPPEIEDKLREAMTTFFGLDPVEYLLIHHLFHGGKLSSFADALRKLAIRINKYKGSEKSMAHAMKEAIGRKWPAIAPVIKAKGRKEEDIVLDEQLDEPLGDLFEHFGVDCNE